MSRAQRITLAAALMGQVTLACGQSSEPDPPAAGGTGGAGTGGAAGGAGTGGAGGSAGTAGSGASGMGGTTPIYGTPPPPETDSGTGGSAPSR